VAPPVQQSARTLSSAIHLNPSHVGDLISKGMGVHNPKLEAEIRAVKTEKRRPHVTSS
jgi:hypothetical protein